MKFSVLLSLYYKESPTYLTQSLDSIFGQTLRADEVVLVEDGPLTPELYAVVDTFVGKFPEIKIIALEKNSGLGNALNEGLKHCSHELVARMDTDDISKPERFARQVAFMEAHSDIDVLGAWVEEFTDTPAQVVSIRKPPATHEEIRRFGERRNPVNHPGVMFRKTAVQAAGGYQPFPLFEDYYLWARMMLNGAHLANVQESLLYFRCSPDTFRRRGGLKYLRVECRFMWQLYRIGFIGLSKALSNCFIRFSVRVFPNSLRGKIYTKLLRKS